MIQTNLMKVFKAFLPVAIVLQLCFFAPGHVVAATTPPTLTITAPTSNTRTSNGVFAVTGTAKSGSGISSVLYSLNGSGWTAASTLNKWTNWFTANLALTVGTNIIKVYAVDNGDNFSKTDSVSFVYVVLAPLTVLANGNGTVTPNDNGALLQIGTGYSITAKAAAGFGFINWTGSATTNGATLKFVMASNLVFTANFVDVTKPMVTIVSPTASLHVSNSTFTVTGKASDNVRVSNVLYSLNGSPWTSAATTNGWTNWMTGVTLIVGTNTLAAYAVDSSGNVSTTNSAKFVYIVTGQLTVHTNGNGTISPNYNNAALQIGASYSMTAKAAAGFGFVNWTGSATTNGATLKFLMESNLTFTANFVDITKPTLSIVYPTAKLQTTNVTLIVSGKASDNVSVADVFYSLNSRDWSEASTGNGWANWFTPSLSLIPATNTIEAYATDTSGNTSATNSVSIVRVANDAFVYTGTNQITQLIGYTNKSGIYDQVEAFSGEVQLFVTNGITPSAVQGFAQIHGGAIIGQIPSMGYYLVSVMPGTESSFISAANNKAYVLQAIPDMPLDTYSDVVDLSGLIGPNGELPVVDPFPAAGPVVGNNTLLYVPDLYNRGTIACGSGFFVHGQFMDYIASENLSGTGEQIDIDFTGNQMEGYQQMASAIDQALNDIIDHPNGRAVINMSFGFGQSAQSEGEFLRFLAGTLNDMSIQAPDAFQRTLFVVAAGNSSFDLSANLLSLHHDFPGIFGASPNMIVVGAQGNTSGYYANFNHSSVPNDPSGNPLMVYAPGVNIPLYPAGGCTGNGTSEAAAATSGLIAQMLAANTNLTLAQVTRAFMRAATNNANPNWLPAPSDVQQAITNLYYSTLTIITDTGTGNGTVVANPPGPTYTNGTVVLLTASPDAVSTFNGWSGAVSSTALTVPIAMNGNQTVTATFNAFPLSIAGSGGNVGDALGTATGCGFTAQVSLGDLVYFEVDNNGGSGPTIATVNATMDDSDGNTFYDTWQGAVTWNGSAFTGTLPRLDTANRPSLSLTITPNTSGQYILNTTVPFTEYLYNLDGSCTGPVETFNYQVNGVIMSPQ